MTLTLRLNGKEEGLIDKLKRMYIQSRATTAILYAVDYTVNHKEENEKKIEILTERLDQTLSNEKEIKLLLDHIKQAGYSFIKH